MHKKAAAEYQEASRLSDFGVNQALVEELWQRWNDNPGRVSAAWRNYFENGKTSASETTAYATANGSRTPLRAAAKAEVNGHDWHALPVTAEEVPFVDRGQAAREKTRILSDVLQQAHEHQGRLSALVNAYRVRGHLFAKLDPLGLAPRPQPELELEHFGLAHVDPSTPFATGDMAGPDQLPLQEIVRRLQETYCRSIGVEFTFLDDGEQRFWLQEQMERTCNHIDLSGEEQLRILRKLTDAEAFEQFLHTSYTGAKRFSLEGAESFIPLLDLCIEKAAALGVEEVVIGMAHRGRLNVLANIMGLGLRQIFSSFEDHEPEKQLGRGDVKYHLGFSSDRRTACGRDVHLTLSFNPSHLEFVNAVVEGRVRAKQDRRHDSERKSVLPLLVHGDAAFMGQGIVAETLNLSLLEGYCVGGTVHVVINNQIGFTTAPQKSRSTHYCTDLTRMLRCPVFHVNGEDPEAVAQAVHLAQGFRQKFGRDAVIDLYCYRKYGHNETDEPRFTQPLMYQRVEKQPTVREVYIDRLVSKGQLRKEQAEEISEQRRQELTQALKEARDNEERWQPASMKGLWSTYHGGPDRSVPATCANPNGAALKELMRRLVQLPAGFRANKKVQRLLMQRLRRVEAGEGIDWGTGEWLAFASLLDEGTRIRLTGQDSCRGTFSHRHAVLYDEVSGAAYTPLAALARQRGAMDIHDSPLSEAGVLGFEYGYALDSPDALVMWEAQFGDFVNGAQVIIDQFISSSEDKWHRLSGVVMLLPHGFEGQGPEHSSGRLERFLALCAEDNMQVCNLTTPAQYYHCLRRQVRRPWRKPLVVMSPKSLLRHPEAVSSLDELAEGQFQRIIDDPQFKALSSSTDASLGGVERVLLCSGKVYYDLCQQRDKLANNKVAIVRVEQLYPLHLDEIIAIIDRYPKQAELVWVQEEPWNMGSWFFIHAYLGSKLTRSLRVISRPASASPATGSMQAHKMEQSRLVTEALTLS